MGYYVKVEQNIKVYVEDLNENSENIIVFLHGWPGSHKLFEYQFDYFAKLGYRCIGIDQRGFGESDKPFNGYDYDTLSDDLKIVMDKLNLKNVTLLGHSTGGAIAIRYISRYKAYGISKLILCAAAAPSLIKRSYFPYGLKESAVRNIIEQTYIDRPKMLKNFQEDFFFKCVSPGIKEWFFLLGIQAAGWSTAAIANTWLNEETLFSDLKNIDIKTLILHGARDKVCLFQLGEQQKKLIKNSKLVKFEHSGHALFYEERDKFNKEVKAFIDE